MVGKLDRKSWYWTPHRLNALMVVLRQIAERDRKGFYFGPYTLAKRVQDMSSQFRDAQVNNGVAILAYLGLIEKGVRGSKASNSGYKRRFYPNALNRPIRWSDIEDYREVRDRELYPWRYDK